jgi:polysaccharide pyruvyl transferase WcaK-like protein
MKFISYSWNGLGNVGDDWIAQSFREYIEKKGHQINSLTEPDSQVSNSKIGDLTWVRFMNNFEGVLKLRHQLRSYDALIIAGGGWFAGDQSLRNSFMWLLRLSVCPIPVYTVGIGAGPFSNRWQILIFKLIKRRIENFNVRHINDAEHLAQLGISDFSVSTDLTFLGPLEYSGLQSQSREKCLVILPAWGKHRDFPTYYEWKSTLLQKLIELKISESDMYFVSFQKFPHEDYDEWCEIFPRHLLVQSISEMERVFRGAKFVVAGRLHAGLAACRYEVPYISVVPYHQKFAILGELGLEITSSSKPNLEFNAPNKVAYSDRHFAAIESLELLMDRISTDLGRQA